MVLEALYLLNLRISKKFSNFSLSKSDFFELLSMLNLTDLIQDKLEESFFSGFMKIRIIINVKIHILYNQ